MEPNVLIALMSFLGTLLGVLASSRLTNHRLAQLEKKVDKHNNVIERMAVVEEKIKVANNRIGDLEDAQK